MTELRQQWLGIPPFHRLFTVLPRGCSCADPPDGRSHADPLIGQGVLACAACRALRGHAAEAGASVPAREARWRVPCTGAQVLRALPAAFGPPAPPAPRPMPRCGSVVGRAARTPPRDASMPWPVGQFRSFRMDPDSDMKGPSMTQSALRVAGLRHKRISERSPGLDGNGRE